MQAGHKDLLWVKMSYSYFGLKNDLFICFCYISPEGSSIYSSSKTSGLDIFDYLEKDIARFNKLGDILIMGDLNARSSQLKDFIDNDCNDHLQLPDYISIDKQCHRNNMDSHVNNYGKVLVEMCCNSNCKILNGRVPGDSMGRFTSHQYGGSSTVDYGIISSDLFHDVQYFKVWPLNHLSDHCPISLSLCARVKHNVENSCNKLNALPVKFIWDEKSNLSFVKAISSKSISDKILHFQINSFKDINEAVSQFNDILNNAAKSSLKCIHPRVKKIINKTKNNKWYDNDVSEMRKRLIKYSGLLDRFPRDNYIRQERYRINKNYKKLIKSKKKEFKSSLCNKIMTLKQSNPKLFWKLLEELGNLNKTQDNYDNISVDSWLNHFKGLNCQENPDNGFSDSIKNSISIMEQNNVSNHMLDHDFTNGEIMQHIKLLKSGKASGSDMILNEMLKHGAPFIVNALIKLFNLVLKSGEFPSQWSSSFIIPIFKSGNSDDANNYRGIAISSCLSKLYTMILNSRLTKYLSDSNQVVDNQFGFKKNHRTTDNIFILKSLITKYVKSKLKKSGNYLFSCFIDFSKAFDSVWREGLFYKLLLLGIGGNFYNSVKSIYKNTKYSVKLKQGTTAYFDSHRGVRQGCNLSPQLFNIFVDGICNKVNTFDPVDLNGSNFNCILYADDLLLLSTSHEGLQKGIDAIQNYCQNWQLKINIKKSKVMVFNRLGTNFNKKFQFYLNGIQIECVDSYNYLGIIFQTNGNFHSATSRLCDKAQKALFQMYRMLWNCNQCYSVSLACKLFDSIVKPTLLYGSDIWGGFSVNLFKGSGNNKSVIENDSFETKLFSGKLFAEKLHIKFTKRVLGVHRKASNSACRSELGRYPLMIDICSSVMSFYQRLHCKKTNNVIIDAAFEQCKTLPHNPWHSFVRKLLQMTELTDAVDNPNFIDIFKSKLKAVYRQIWGREIMGSNKLKTFETFKNSYQFENYLDGIKIKHHRVALTKFRISAHFLPIESDRHRGVNRDERYCNLHDSNVVGDEKHYIFHCNHNKVKECRNKFLTALFVYAPEYQNTPMEDLFRIIFSSSDKFIFSILANFVFQILDLF